jgi:hypothetical protein
MSAMPGADSSMRWQRHLVLEALDGATEWRRILGGGADAVTMLDLQRSAGK